MRFLLLFITVNSFAMGNKKPCEYWPSLPWCKVDPVPPDPEPEPPVPEPEPPVSDFDWELVKKYGGPEIGIDKDIAKWPVTRKFTLKGISGMKLNSSIDGKAYAPAIDGLSGNFAMCAEQDDKMYICGTIDYCRASYQTVKTLSNLEYGGTMAESFNLHKGQKVCFFYTGLSRSSKRNLKEKSQLECVNWPY